MHDVVPATRDPNLVAAAAAELARQAATVDPRDRESYLIAARELRAFHVDGDHADIRGWAVFAFDARLVGAVDRLMIQLGTRKVRYVSVTLAHHAADDRRPTPGGSVLVPVGLIRRLDARHAIEVEQLTSRQLVSAPRLHARPVTRADENATLAAYGLATAADVAPEDLYSGPHFDERRLVLSVQ